MSQMNGPSLRTLGFSSLVPMNEAIDGFLARISPVQDVEMLSLADTCACGRVLARDIKAPRPVPPHDRSAMDGYAIHAVDSFGASVHQPKHVRLVGTVTIDQLSGDVVEPGHAVKVATGSPLPAGVDAVIKIEDTETGTGDGILIYAPVTPGQNVIKKGEDYGSNQDILARGHLIAPQDLGVLATVGIKHVPVFRKVRASIIATGNELVDLDALHALPDGTIDLDSLHPASVVNSNAFTIAALVRIAGGEVPSIITIPDDEMKIKTALDQQLERSDIIITTGGTSVGEKDLMPVIIGQQHEIVYHGIAMKPGSATLLGMAKNKPVTCVSGFPVASEMAMLYFVMPAIHKIGGRSILDPRIIVPARLDRAVPVKGFGVTHLLRVKLDYAKEPENALPLATPVKLSGSSAQRSMVESVGIVEIPPDMEGYEANAIVRVKMHPRW